MGDTDGHDYPPAGWTAAGIEDALGGGSELPTYGDADAWATLRDDPLTAPVVEDLRSRAADAAGDPVPRAPATRYLEYERAGNRTRYQERTNARTRRLSLFALAECFERDGGYLDPILDHAWAICEQATWTWPAHLDEPENVEGLPAPVPDGERTVALVTVGTAKLLAELDRLLGDRLHPALRERIRHEVDRRVFAPYLARDDHWWLSGENNWNAVCNGGTLIAALHLADDDRAARIAANAAASMRHYIDGFGPDGCTAEGIGYWNYGFGNYVQAAARLEAATGGAYSLLSPPIVGDIAAYPLAVELSPGRYLPFSDAAEDTTVAPYALAWLGRRLDEPGLAARGRRAFEEGDPLGDLPEALRNLWWTREVPTDWTVPTPPPRRYFRGHDWWLARDDPEDPDGLVVAAKGGHNAEAHNHNDCGTFVVHYRGESLLTDLGAPTYDRDYFSDARYADYLAPRSLGHSVPHVNGREQAAGEAYAAEVIDRREGDDVEAFELELAGCYPDGAGLDALRRRIALERGAPGTVHVEDRPAFAGEATEFESVLVSYCPMDSRGGEVVVTGDAARATVTPDRDAAIGVERLADAVDDDDVWRARIAPEAAGRGVELGLTVAVEPR